MSWKCACGQENADGTKFCNQCGAPSATPLGDATAPPAPEPVPAALPTPPVSAPAAAPPAKTAKVLVLVVGIVAAVLVGTCVLGILAAIAIPNFIAAKDRAQQKRAMADMRAISVACQSYKIDSGAYPNTGHDGSTYYSISDVSALQSALVPKYMPTLPEKDPWGHPYSYGISQDASEFVLICAGSDGENKLEAIPDKPVTTSCYEDEIVVENGDFIQQPEGQQKHCK